MPDSQNDALLAAAVNANIIDSVTSAAGKTQSPLVFYAILGLFVISLGVAAGALHLLMINAESSNDRYDALLSMVSKIVERQDMALSRTTDALISQQPGTASVAERAAFKEMMEKLVEQNEVTRMMQSENQAIIMSLSDRLELMRQRNRSE